ncbi:MAG: hypothetical protein DME61_01240 [Verrucomicrobia bacterium]|nr:MAG: hypothetical protein DME61_01240 [Verrucomicrobiota bacterium]
MHFHFLLIHRSLCNARAPVEGCENFHIKSCCHQPEARLVASRFSTIVLGGTAALHAQSGVGGGNFFADENLPLARARALARLLPEQSNRLTLNVQRLMSKLPISGQISWQLAFTLGAVIVAIVVVVIFLRVETWPARTARQSTAELERLGKDLRAAFIDIAHLQPRITINNRVYMEQSAPVSELAVLSRRIEVEHELLHTWVGSSKRVKLHGTFIAKAGFDLLQNLSIGIRPEEIIVQLPHAKILGVEQEQVDVLAFENGLWNRISGQDLQEELSVLPQLAWKRAIENGLPAEAEHTLQRQLDERLHTPQPLRLSFKDTTPNKEK